MTSDGSGAASRVARAQEVLGRIRSDGAVEPFRRFLYRRGVYRRLGVIVTPRLEPFRGKRHYPEGTTASLLDAAQLDEYLALRPDQTREEIEWRLEAGHVCLLAHRDGAMVGHSWLGMGRIPVEYLDCTMDLRPDTSHQYDDFVVPERRGTNTLRAVVPLRREVVKARGLAWNVSMVLPENELAFRRIARHRPVFVAEIGRANLAGRSRLFLRVDRELVGRRPLRATFRDLEGRPAWVQQARGPLLLAKSPWTTDRGVSPHSFGSQTLGRLGLVRRHLLFLYGSDQELPGQLRFPVKATRLEAADLDAYLAFRPDQTREEIDARLAAGHVGFLGRSHGRIVASAWLAPGGGGFRTRGVDAQLDPETAGAYDDFVTPEFRRQHLLDRLDEARSAHALESGWKRCLALVPPEIPGAWIRMRRNERPCLGELRGKGLGAATRWTLRLEPGADLPCTLTPVGSAPLDARGASRG